MTEAMHRTPCLETAKIRLLLNGPESFTPDGNFILGEAPELERYFVAAGFNSGGHRQLRRRGAAARRMDRRRQPAERPLRRRHPPLRPVHGEPQAPLRAHRRDARPALRDALAAPRARDGRGRCAPRRFTTCSPRRARASARRTAGSAPTGSRRRGSRAPETEYAFGRPHWLDDVIAEQRATREAVALYDQTSFGKLLLQGRDALAVLERLCANDVDVRARPHGLHRAPQRARRLRERPDDHPPRAESFLLVTGSAQATRDADWIGRHVAPTSRRRSST